MNAEKERLLYETHQKFMDTGLNSPESLDILDELVAPGIMGFGTTIDERIFSVADLKKLITRQREQSHGIRMHWTIIPLVRNVVKEENIAVFVDDIALELIDDKDSIKMSLRWSSVMEYKDEKWMVIHFHGSKPENVATEEDTWGIEKWKSRNAELEMQVKERTAQLEKSIADLKAAQSQLIQSEKMASLGELTAGIAHEIQNPLNFVNNFSELNTELIGEMKQEIEQGNLEEAKLIAKDIEANEQKIVYHGKRADAIVKGMLQHSRSSSGMKEPTDINALCDEYLRLSYHGLRAKDKSFNVAYTTDFDNNIGKVHALPQDLGRVILNLLTNAFYVVSEKKKLGIEGYEPAVSISTKMNAGKATIIVTDNGNGIPSGILNKIFQPFFTTKPTGEGTGLGLSLSYDIITKGHGGELKVETKEGSGTSFIIILPVYKFDRGYENFSRR